MNFSFTDPTSKYEIVIDGPDRLRQIVSSFVNSDYYAPLTACGPVIAKPYIPHDRSRSLNALADAAEKADCQFALQGMLKEMIETTRSTNVAYIIFGALSDRAIPFNWAHILKPKDVEGLCVSGMGQGFQPHRVASALQHSIPHLDGISSHLVQIQARASIERFSLPKTTTDGRVLERESMHLSELVTLASAVRHHAFLREAVVTGIHMGVDRTHMTAHAGMAALNRDRFSFIAADIKARIDQDPGLEFLREPMTTLAAASIQPVNRLTLSESAARRAAMRGWTDGLNA